jgi:CRISPR associated protein Cas1
MLVHSFGLRALPGIESYAARFYFSEFAGMLKQSEVPIGVSITSPRFGRPALALDLMEPFRPMIADSVVLTAVNTRMVTAADFIPSGPAVALKTSGRKNLPCLRAVHGYAGDPSHVRVSCQLPASVGDTGQGVLVNFSIQVPRQHPVLSPVDMQRAPGSSANPGVRSHRAN